MPLSAVPANLSCPHCGANETECLTRLSAIAIVDYYRCPACAHVWSVPRSGDAKPCDTDQRPA